MTNRRNSINTSTNVGVTPVFSLQFSEPRPPLCLTNQLHVIGFTLHHCLSCVWWCTPNRRAPTG